MAIKTSQGFKITSDEAIDANLTLTKAEMKSINEDMIPDKYFTICQDDGKLYLFNKANTVDEQTGKFRLQESGGGNYIAGNGIDITNNTISITEPTAKQQTLTQAEYDALTQEQKNNGTIYFISDAQGGDADKIFYLRQTATDVYDMTFAELKAMYDEKKLGVFVGTGQHIFPFIDFVYYPASTGDERLTFKTAIKDSDVFRIFTVKPDNSITYETTDTGWQDITVDSNITEPVSLRCCRKNGVVYFSILSSNLLLTKSTLLIATLPAKFRPTQGVWTVGTTTGFMGVAGVGISGDGNVTVHAVGPSGTTGTGISFNTSYPV